MRTIILLSILISISCSGQEVKKIEKIHDNKLIELMNSVNEIIKYETDDFGVTIFKLTDLSSTAPTSETHERMDYYLIAISEFDEYPMQSLFKLGNFFNSEIIKTSKSSSSLRLDLQYSTQKGIDVETIYIELHSVKFL